MQTATNNRSRGAGNNKLNKMKEGVENENEPEGVVQVMVGGFRCRSRENRRREEGGRVCESRESPSTTARD